MESATLTRPRPGTALLARLRAAPGSTWAKLALLTICAAALAGYLLAPTYPTYDSFYALLWGRNILHLHLPDFQVYRSPTEHPLAIAFGVLMAVFGQAGARLMILGAIASFVALVVGLYRLGRLCFGPVVGVTVALLMLSRFDFESLAGQGYLDIPYIALIVWAAVLEVSRPRRGTPVFLLLAGAGLLRPEAWVLTGIYLLWCGWHGDRRTRLRYLTLAAIAPVVWVGLDTLVTGDPVYSLHSTSGLAEELGRTQGLSHIPGATWAFLLRLDKLPLVLGAIGGGLAAVFLTPRRTIVPLVVVAAGIGTFALLGAAGLSVIDRYLLMPAAFALLFTAFGLAGWSLLERGSRVRQVWMAAAAALVIYGTVAAIGTVNLTNARNQLAYRDLFHTNLQTVLDNPTVRHDLRTCGPLSLPNNKLVPDARWILGTFGQHDIVARSQARADAAKGAHELQRRISRGVAIYPLGDAVFREAIVDVTDDPLDQVPQRGFTRLMTTQYYAVYVHC